MGKRVCRIFFSPAEQRDDTEKSSEQEENKHLNGLIVVSRHDKRGENRRIIRADEHDGDEQKEEEDEAGENSMHIFKRTKE